MHFRDSLIEVGQLLIFFLGRMNFCTQSLCTTISTDQAEEDGYPVSNLLEHTNELSTSLFLSSRTSGSGSSSGTSGGNGNGNGFMAARFAKTPVKIKLEFQVPIEISHIVLCPTVSKQTSSGFQIDTVITGKAKGPGEKYSLSTQTVAREFINSTVPNVLVFKNPRFILKPQYHSMPLRQFELYRNFPKAFGLKHTSFFACEKVKSLELTILKVSGSSIPSIGSLQVWGQPSVHCTRSERDRLVKAWVDTISTQRRLILCKRHDDGDNNDDSKPGAKRLKIVDADEDDPQSRVPEIPEEFIDPITYEIMTQPLRLPCGIAIDSSTLDKYNLEEAKWGRHPNDPFTALTFNNNNQPISDTVLRARIDRFLSQNSEDSRFYNLPRTLGNSSGSEPPARSDLIRPNDKNTEVSLRPNRAPVANTLTQELETLLGSTSREFLPALATTTTTHVNPGMKNSISKADTREGCMKCDLKFIESGAEPSRKLFYSSTCSHVLLCRSCLLSYDKNEEQKCTSCNLKWKVKDLFRFHKK